MRGRWRKEMVVAVPSGPAIKHHQHAVPKMRHMHEGMYVKEEKHGRSRAVGSGNRRSTLSAHLEHMQQRRYNGAGLMVQHALLLLQWRAGDGLSPLRLLAFESQVAQCLRHAWHKHWLMAMLQHI